MAKKKDDLLATARKRFERCIEAETKNREKALEAIKFRNLEQWPDGIKRDRENDPEGARPCLVVDKINQYINQVKNDQRQNRPAIKVRPVDDKGDKEVAEIYQGIVRHIEDVSKADHAYDTAYEHAVDGGFGYWRIITEYTDENSFEQDIRVKRVRNRFSVYLDPDHQEPDGSDAKYGFITEWLPRDDFKATYPDADACDWESDGKDLAEWVKKDEVRIAEYFYFENVKGKLLLLEDGRSMLESEAKELMGQGVELPAVIKDRDTTMRKVKWCKMSGKERLEERDWPGKYIPIIEVVGNELDIEGERHLSGMVRAAMDAQRIHNYSSSSFVENVALAPKAPFIAAVGQIEGQENDWQTANRRNLAVLQYQPVSVDGHPVPPPIRMPMPGISPGWQQVMANTEHDIQASLGMYSASVGEESNEKSGKAILARQREGDVANFHYIDNLARSIRHTGRILVDLIPKVYDTERVARILGEDGTHSMAMLNPEQEAPVIKTGVKKIYNLGIGKYDVSVTVGPSYTTKRQEAAESMVELVRAQPELMSIVGDLMIRNMDWPGADQIADRLKTMLPPQIQQLEDKDTDDPKMAAVHAQYESTIAQVKEEAAAFIQELQQKLQEAMSDNQDKEQKIRELTLAVNNKQGELAVRMQEAKDKRDIEIAKLMQGQPQEGEMHEETEKTEQPPVNVYDSSFAGPIAQSLQTLAEVVSQGNQLQAQNAQLLAMVAQEVSKQNRGKRIVWDDKGNPVGIEPIELEGVH